jgi:hypothetical protein
MADTTCTTARTIKAAPKSPNIQHSPPGRLGQQQKPERTYGRSRYIDHGRSVRSLITMAVLAGQAASRSIGQVMQRGPPRPRPSSLPAIVTTSMPCLRSMVLVGTLRS